MEEARTARAKMQARLSSIPPRRLRGMSASESNLIDLPVCYLIFPTIPLEYI